MTKTPEQVSRMLERMIHTELGAWDAGRARSTQVHLGPSQLGGCREFIRATIAGDPQISDTRLKWAAFVGTAVGDLVESALGERVGAETQQDVTVRLPSGIEASGHTDAVLLGDHLMDFKTKATLEKVAPTYKQWVQVSAYLVGLVQMGKMSTGGTASLVFLDRSGANEHPVVFTISYEEALTYLESVDERLADVARAVGGEDVGDLRDEPESWCHYTKCPFRGKCWVEENKDLGPITAAEHVDAMRQYDEGRRMVKAGKALQDEAKSTLGAFAEEAVVGESAEFKLRWKDGRYGRTIDLRAREAQPEQPETA